ncbi:hypothetical protein KAFR_0A00290 [Kazachstania africana CBS 2517]|uniref:UBX domain-containing protein n=1 Tax=Kazachstania africana (strain ATCC 22294 / BCRC 22015 / CBS 2517 / CECT 1963 / NBRC 1671 / NRRL Y-8276) TaxID=1071382 RepID=H2AM67_KAZAF|nr:hypothetical protein KAFR_0A00290 [Kazachstania africana CBS 2517]CCF55467.1 hypothetical protein KAFR_0A00290 [Kazachstania africana CBS 2517]
MATVFVKYKFTTFRSKIAPNATLNDVLSQSLDHFNVSKDGSYHFLRNGKKIELNVPWRLLNLPAGAKFELIDVETKENSEKPIKIRFQIDGFGSMIREVQAQDVFLKTLQSLQQEKKWDFNLRDISVRVFNKAVYYSELENMSFASLGFVEPTSVRIGFIDAAASSIQLKDTEMENPMPEASVAPIKEDVQVSPEPHVIHKPTAYIPSEESIISQLITQDEGDDTYELTVDQARRYQQILSNKTGSLGGPLLTKRLREQRELEMRAKRNALKECFIRIKFPDLTFLEIVFKPSDTMKIVYNEVSKALIDEDMEFTLFQTHPMKELSADDSLLADDLEFGSKTVLLFKSINSNQELFLRSSILQHAKKLNDLNEVKIDQGSVSATKVDDESSTKVSKTKALNKIPKWLKLGKK